jgi:hypothetical protein
MRRKEHNKRSTVDGATTFSKTTLSIMSLFATLSISDIEHNVFSVIMFSVVMLNVAITLNVMLSVIVLNVVMLSVVAPR